MTSICCKCNEELKLKESVQLQCKDCLSYCHFECATIKKNFLDISTWICDHCEKNSSHKSTAMVEGRNDITVNDVYVAVSATNTMLDKVKKEQSIVVQHMNDVMKAQQLIIAQYNEISKKLGKIDEISQELSQLRSICNEKDDAMVDIEYRLASAEQYHRRCVLEISNVEERKGENLIDLIQTISRLFGVRIQRDDIASCHRININSRYCPLPILVTFHNMRQRNELFQKRQVGVLTNKSLFGAGNDSLKIYIKDALTPYFRNLLWMSKIVAKEKGYKYCWYQNYKILMKKHDNSRIIAICHSLDLNNVN